ncbi:MAG TPA: adenosylcobinamide-phosphate synthase CbiB [Methanotrichaceae archaeon]|nr:adenosylcobinamide-phosphate synthase CbiB [Methanotrichaceae archaeon]
MEEVSLMPMSWALQVLLLALAWDLILGEPPARFHPVVIMGRAVASLRRRVPRTRLSGAAVASLMVIGSALCGHLLLELCSALPGRAAEALVLLCAAYLLKSTLAFRSLLETSRDIGRAIEKDILKARDMLPALVSRNPSGLSSAQARSAVIESLSENFVDTVVSPIFFFLLLCPWGLGVESALAFKAISTMDSMLGYRTPELRDLGFVPARLDDLANWLPARLGTLFIMAAWPGRAGPALRASLRYGRATPSPNSGWPMAAAAGALGVRLEKPGIYVLLEEGRSPKPGDIDLALSLVGRAMGLCALTAVAILWQLP